jgi:hypothetical protein
MITPSWTFEKRTRQRPSGINLAEPNFTRESRNIVRLFEREFDQNVIDARSDDPAQPGKKRSAHIRVKILHASNGLGVNLLTETFQPLEENLIAAGHPATDRDWKNPRVLVIEEFQTMGLTGVVDNSYADGEDQRWANFWFGEGKRSKGKGALGRQGQGKITYHLISGARALLAHTRRENDANDYVFGKCIVQKSHDVGSEKYTPHGYWPKIDTANDGQPLPETDPVVIARIKAGFSLQRKSEPGTSWIIPFIPGNFTADALLREFVGDFFFSVLNGDLTAEIGGVVVDSGTLQQIVEDLKIQVPSQDFFTFLVDGITSPTSAFVTANIGWEKGDKMNEESFTEPDISKLRESLQAGNLVSVRLPVTLRPKDGSELVTHIEVHLRTGEHITGVEEIYVRSGLVIADEQHLRDQTQNAFGMVLANEVSIAEFLGYCEVASHLQWNAKEKEANDRYFAVAETLSYVRKSLPRLFRLLAGTSDAIVDDALDDILSLPVVGKAKTKIVKKKKPAVKRPKTRPPELFIQLEKQGQWQLVPGADAVKAKYPMELNFRFAYDRLHGTGNPWGKWHPFDFDLSNPEFEPKKLKHAQVTNRDGQEVSLKILSPEFCVTLEGFSKEQPLLINEISHAK